MRIIDDKTFDSLLERIDALKNELSLLEEQVKALPVSEPVEEPVVDAGQPLEAGQVHPRFAAAEYGLTSTAAPAEPELVVAEPEPVAPAVILSEAKDLPESQDLPVDEPEEPIDIAPVDDTPIDITISDVEDMPDDAVQPLESGLNLKAAPAEASEPRKAILDTAKADTAVMDIMAEKQAWRTDRPGMPVKNIISAISLNDRVLLINVLFGEDPMLFQETIAKFNSMGSLSEALAFISENHPDWDMNSEPVYRLMMAVRRKLS
ncbi:MAG: hypothetical protein K6F06_02375 [Bacteroidales bacterium]|nr:hypothetical protein [Bacteroidales bacterium]